MSSWRREIGARPRASWLAVAPLVALVLLGFGAGCREPAPPSSRVLLDSPASSLGSAERREGEWFSASSANPGAMESTPGELSLTVVVRGLRNDRGVVAIALFDAPERFPEQQKARAIRTNRVVGGEVQVRFEGLPRGRYALAAHHDENKNRRMDYSWLGIPREGFAFSNGAKVGFGPPPFESAAIDVESNETREILMAQYF